VAEIGSKRHRGRANGSSELPWMSLILNEMIQSTVSKKDVECESDPQAAVMVTDE